MRAVLHHPLLLTYDDTEFDLRNVDERKSVYTATGRVQHTYIDGDSLFVLVKKTDGNQNVLNCFQFGRLLPFSWRLMSRFCNSNDVWKKWAFPYTCKFASPQQFDLEFFDIRTLQHQFTIPASIWDPYVRAPAAILHSVCGNKDFIFVYMVHETGSQLLVVNLHMRQTVKSLAFSFIFIDLVVCADIVVGITMECVRVIRLLNGSFATINRHSQGLLARYQHIVGGSLKVNNNRVYIKDEFTVRTIVNDRCYSREFDFVVAKFWAVHNLIVAMSFDGRLEVANIEEKERFILYKTVARKNVSDDKFPELMDVVGHENALCLVSATSEVWWVYL
jgi:hypothetical protein